MTAADDLFAPGGVAVALLNGCDLSVDVGAYRPVTLSYSDLTCRRCERPFDTPKRNPARFLAFNKALNGGLCRRCDPPDADV